MNAETPENRRIIWPDPRDMLGWDFNTALNHIPIGRTLFNELVMTGKVRCHRAGNKRVFLPDELREDIRNLPLEQNKGVAA